MNKNIIKTWPLTIVAVLAAVSVQAQPVPTEDNAPEFDQPVEFLGRAHKNHGDFLRKVGKRMDPGHRLLDMSARLKLTDEQELQILKLSQSFRSEIEANQEPAKAAHETLKTMRENKAFDEDTFRDAMAVIQPAMLEGMVLRAKYMEDLGAILTDEQKAEVEAMKAKLKQRGKRFLEGRKDRVEKNKKRGSFHDQRGL